MGSVWNEEKHGSPQQAAALEGAVLSDLDALVSMARSAQQRLRRNAPVRAMGSAAAAGLIHLMLNPEASDDAVRQWVADVNTMVLTEAARPGSGPATLS